MLTPSSTRKGENRSRWAGLALAAVALWLGYVCHAPLSFSQEIDARTLPVRSELALRLKDHVEYLASPSLRGREPGTEGNRVAARYIVTEFRRSGLQPLTTLPSYRQTISTELGDNLIGVRRAIAPLPQAPWLLIGAHYDHLGGNYLGADDNAAAVSILLEIARALPPLLHHHVLFVAFNAEESPFIRTSTMGSQHFVDHLPPDIGSPSHLKAVVIMDLVGGVHWEPIKNVVFATGAEKSLGLYRRVKQATTTRLTDDCVMTIMEGNRGSLNNPQSVLRSCQLAVLPLGLHLVEQVPLIGQVAFSDYDAFRNENVPFVFLSAGRTPRYHQTTDLPDTLHYERMAATVEWLMSLLQLIDQDTQPYEFVPERIEIADEAATLQPLVGQAAQRETKIPGTSSLSLRKMQRDQEWLEQLDPAAAMPADVKRLERTSIRMQCLLADFFLCFLI